MCGDRRRVLGGGPGEALGAGSDVHGCGPVVGGSALARAALASALLWTAACTTPGDVTAAEAPSERADSVGVDDVPRGRGPRLVLVDVNLAPAAGAEAWLVDREALRPDLAVIASRTTGDWVATTRAIAVETRVAGADGVVQFEHVPTSGYLVVARLEEQLGAAERAAQAAPSGQPIEMTLVPRTRYRIRVVDVAGAPATGVAVTLATQVGDELRQLPATAFTDNEGLATLYEPPTAAFIAAGEAAPPADAYGRLALVRIPSSSRPWIKAQPEGVATVVLPPTVPLTVRADHRGFTPDHWSGVVQVFRARDGSRSDSTLAFELVDGVAQLPHVEVGVDLRVIAVVGEASAEPGRYVGSVSRSIRGAKDRSQGLACALQLDGGVLVAARCLDEAGLALARTAVDVFVIGEPATSWTVLTDDNGRLRWLLPRVDRSLVGARIGFRARGEGGADVGRAAAQLAEPGAAPALGATVDLGDVVLK